MIASRFTGRRVLLAVGALACAPAIVHVATPAPPRVVASPGCAGARSTAAGGAEVIVVFVPQPVPAVIEVMQPRVMPSGAPACGNVTARPIPGCERSTR